MGNAGTQRQRIATCGTLGSKEARAYFEAVGSLPAGQAKAISELVSGLISDGVWPQLDYVYPMCGNTFTTALVSLKSPSPSTNLTSTAFVAADYSPSLGITGNGSTKYLTSPFLASLPGNFSMGCYNTTVNNGSTLRALMGGGTTGIQRWIFNTNGGVVSSGQFASGTRLTPTMSVPYKSLFSIVELGTGISFYQDSAELSRSTQTLPTSAQAGRIPIFCYNTNQYFNPNSIGFVFFGRGMTATQMAMFSTRVNIFMRAIGRKADPTLNVAFDGIALCGQSLATGQGQSTSYFSTDTSTGDIMYPSGIVTGAGSPSVAFNMSKFVEMVDYVRPSIVPSAVGAIRAAGGAVPFFSAGQPITGAAYASIAKNTATYISTIECHRAAAVRLAAAGGSYTVRANFCVHGENDDSGNNTNYQANLVTWQSDYETDLKAATGQSASIPMFISQMNTYASYSVFVRTTPLSAQQQYLAWKNNPTNIILVCPKYIFAYVDTVHMSDYRQLGEYYGKAYYQTIVQGTPFAPLAPLSVVRSGTDITVVFNKGGLVMDTSIVSDPGGTYASRKFGTAASSATDSTVTNYRGFEFMDDNATNPSANITGHSITTTTITDDTVVFTLSGVPTGTNPRLRAAWTMTTGATSRGPTLGPRCNLRDADASFASQLGYNLYNWCVTFDEAVS